MHITNQKLSFYVFMVVNLQNIFMEHDLNILMIFGHKREMYNFDTYKVMLAIATNIAVLFMTAFVLQGHTFLSHRLPSEVIRLSFPLDLSQIYVT